MAINLDEIISNFKKISIHNKVKIKDIEHGCTKITFLGLDDNGELEKFKKSFEWQKKIIFNGDEARFIKVNSKQYGYFYSFTVDTGAYIIDHLDYERYKKGEIKPLKIFTGAQKIN